MTYRSGTRHIKTVGVTDRELKKIMTPPRFTPYHGVVGFCVGGAIVWIDKYPSITAAYCIVAALVWWFRIKPERDERVAHIRAIRARMDGIEHEP